MLLNINDIRKLNSKNEDMSYVIVEKCIEKFFNDLVKCYGILNQNFILIDSAYLPYQYLSVSVIEKIIILLECNLGYSIIVQKLNNNNKGYINGDLIQILLFDPDDYKEDEVNIQLNSITAPALYSTFNEFNNLYGTVKEEIYMTCNNRFLLNEKINKI